MTECQRLLAHLHRGGRYAYLWTYPERRSYWAPVGDLPPPPAGARNVYFGVHPTTEIPRTNSRNEPAAPERVRAQIPYIAAINCLFAEFDAVQFGDDKERILAHIAGLPCRPNVLVDSGGGYHAYWLLREPFYLEGPEARGRAVRIQAAWVELAGGDIAAKDLARVLRLPGTLNHKYDPPQPVQFVRCDWEPPYELSDLARLCRAAAVRRRPVAQPDARALAPAGLPGAGAATEDAEARAREWLERLARWRCDDYDAWVHVGMALSELGPAGLDLWRQWSRGSPKYRERDCEAKWPTFRPGEGLTLASLAYWAQQDDPHGLPAPPRERGGPPGLRWRGRKGERAFLQGKEVRYCVQPEGHVWHVRASSGPGRRGVELTLPRSVPAAEPDDLEAADGTGPDAEATAEAAHAVAVAFNVNLAQVHRELAEIPEQMAAHPSDAEALPPANPAALRDFAPWVAQRLSARGGRRDRAVVGQALAAWLLREQRLLRDADTDRPYLLGDDGQCLALSQPGLALEATLAEAGLNASEMAYQWVLADLRVAAHDRGRLLPLQRWATWDAGRGAIYLSCGPEGYVAAQPGADLLYYRNGMDDVIFAAEASLPPWYPGAEPVDPLALAAFRPALVAPAEVPTYTPEVQRRLLAAWLVGLVAGVRPLPLLVLLGVKGGGKTTLGRSALRLLLGEAGGLTLLSGDMRDFWSLLQGRPVAGFDNVDGTLPPWFVDALAAAATGGRVQKRELYTDDTVRDRGVQAAITVTSRTAPFARADVAERALPLFTTEFADGARRPDSELDREVAERRDGMLVYLLRRASQVLPRQREAPDELPARFLDFARLVWAWHAVDGRAADARPVLEAWRAAQTLSIGDADPLLAAILEHAPKEKFVRITATELVRRLVAAGAELPYLGGGQGIARHLRELRRALALAGWTLEERRAGDQTHFSLVRRSQTSHM